MANKDYYYIQLGLLIATATIHQSIKRKDYPGVLHKPNNKPGEDTHSFEFFASCSTIYGYFNNLLIQAQVAVKRWNNPR